MHNLDGVDTVTSLTRGLHHRRHLLTEVRTFFKRGTAPFTDGAELATPPETDGGILVTPNDLELKCRSIDGVHVITHHSIESVDIVTPNHQKNLIWFLTRNKTN